MNTALSSGTKLGPYEVLSRIGAGGMGEVWRARDTRLDRTVAIKILPAEFAHNAQLKVRFEREAKTISQLNHPNICTLHDIGQQDGVDYLVMELLDGETLADRLVRGPLPVAQVLQIGSEIASALDRAHRAGIVHRDLKPGNIVLTKSGAKLLDFGLAKPAAEGQARGESVLPDATQHKPLTQEGTIVGTYQYMSPEQISGEAVDTRTDIFALGAVLYEMLTGHAAFRGKNRTSVVAAIISAEPQPISAEQPLTPPALERVIRTCLAKDPDDRWQTAHDVRLELEWIAQAGSQAGVAAPVAQRRRSRETVAWTLAAILVLVIVASAVVIAKLRHVEPFVTDVAPPRGLRYNAVGDVGGPLVISPDGTLVVYSVNEGGATHLVLRSLVTGEARSLTGTDGAHFPFWSPDSRKIGFFTLSQLKRVDISGGAPVPITDVIGARGGAWGANDTIVFTPSTQTQLYKVPASGGKPQPLTTVDPTQHTSHRWPSFLPDGKRFLYLACNHQDPGGSMNAVYLADVDGGAPRMIFRSVSNAVYADGYLLFGRDQTLWAQKVKSDLTPEGDPVAIAQDALYDAGVWRAAFSVANNGVLTYHSGRASLLSSVVWLDRHGVQVGSVGEKDSFWDVEIAPNQQRVVLPIGDPMREMWVHDLQRNTRTKLTLTGWPQLAVWSADSSTVFADIFRNGEWLLVAKKLTGTETVLARQKKPISPRTVSPDGQWLYLQTNGISRLRTDGAGQREIVVDNPTALNPAVSPNGKWLAYQSDENGHTDVFVMSLTQRELKWQVTSNGGGAPRWRGDGKELFFIDSTRHVVAMPVTESGDSLDFGTPQQLFVTALRPQARSYDVAADGTKFLLDIVADQESPTVVVLNDWRLRLH